MKIRHHLIAITILVGGILTLFSFHTLRSSHQLISPLLSQNVLSNSVINISPTPSTKFTAGFPATEEIRALESIKKSNGHLTTIFPVWYELNIQGEPKLILSDNKNNIRQLASEAKILLIPSITNNTDPKRTHLFLSSYEKRQSFIKTLLLDAKAYNYAGYDLYWNQIMASDSATFLSFARSLNLELAASERILSITVTAPNGKPSEWEETIGDSWRNASRITEYFCVMAFQDNSQTSAPQLPVTIPWFINLLRYAKEIIPPEKLVIGLPTYGYDMSNKQTTREQYADIQKLAGDKKITWIRNTNSDNLTATYSAQGVIHTIWTEDSQSINRKIQIAKTYQINRFSLWFLGGEDSNLW